MVKTSLTDQVRSELSTIMDPEVPVVNIVELGIVRDIEVPDDQTVIVTITPTYSGCPAMDFISTEVLVAMQSIGFQNIDIQTVLSPAWTTDWMTDEARQKLKDYGIAPPRLRDEAEKVSCPRCESQNVRKVSEFGSTSCKALYQCEDCSEPFDYFKCI